MTALGDNLRCTATIATGDALDVREAVVHERLSSLFSVRLTVVCDNPDVDFEAAIGQPAGFTLQSVVGQERHRAGRASAAQLQQLAGRGRRALDLPPDARAHALARDPAAQPPHVPAALGARHRARSSSASGASPRCSSSRATYKKRKYRVQYGESDFAFMCRMLEDAGISFYFEQQGEETKLVLSDAPADERARAPPNPVPRQARRRRLGST